MIEWLSNPYVRKGLESLLALAVILILAKGAVSFSAKNGRKAAETPFAIKYAAVFFIALSLVFIWLESLGPIITALTLLATALTLVAKELILNFIGSFVIFWRELFTIGDRVRVGEVSGDVIDKGVLYFTLLETGESGLSGHSTGRLIKVPNALTLTQPVINATRGAGYVWNEIGLAVTRESDREKARTMLIEAVEKYYASQSVDLERIRRIFEQRRVFFKELTPRVYLDVTTRGYLLTLRYLCRSRLARESRDVILTTFINRLPDSGVELADEQPAA
ncbi:mechanosensitive ion channel domain-containing protein [Pseudodesulfovibrio sp.]|uniref:mechanosensitive ion channel domain-containing protein n=1 Tax=unclassified Pseudodesulfovibrio TaxID=2661612 RepID=UPI003B008C17